MIRTRIPKRLLTSARLTLSEAFPIPHETKVTQSPLSKSSTFLQSLSPTFSYNKDADYGTRKQVLKQHLVSLLATNKYDVLLDFLHQWTRDSSVATITSTLSRSEISEILAKVVRHQVRVMHNFVLDEGIIRARTGQKAEPSKSADFARARKMKNQIRDFVSSLLYTQGFVYSRENRNNYSTKYNFCPRDYESMIYLEMHNNKYDLASLWFRHFEKRHSLGEMTYKMWIMRFQLFSGGYPSFWEIESTLSATTYRPGKSYLVSKIPFSRNFYEFLNTFKKNGDTLVLDPALTETLILSIGHSRDLSYLDTFLKKKYGMGIDGKKDNAAYEKPSIRIVRAVFLALAYNGKFFEGLACVNGFQRHYSIELDSPAARTFWESVFRWCDISTKYDDKKAFPYFLKDTGKSSPSLEEAMADADFDYAGYLGFKKDLESRRVEAFSSLWALYVENGCIFSKQVLGRYLAFLKEHDNEKMYYGFMNVLGSEWERYRTSQDSFNKTDTVELAKDYDEAIYAIYMDAIRALIDLKWKAILAGQCEPIIRKWSLDERMEGILLEWWGERIGRYREMVERKREEFMVGLKREGGLLDLFEE